MTKQECEAKLLDLLEQAHAVMREFDESAEHLSMFASPEGLHVTGYRWDGEKFIYYVDSYRLQRFGDVSKAVNV